MTQQERADFLIAYLLSENEEYKNIAIPANMADKQRLLRSLMNVRPPFPVSTEFLNVQDEYLQQRLHQKGITKIEDLSPIQPGLYLWQGDITTLVVDAIVNAANSQMLGCFIPATNVSIMPFLTQSHRGLPGQARSNAAALRISVGFDCL